MAIHKSNSSQQGARGTSLEKIVANYGTTLGNSEVQQFSDGEFQPCFNGVDPRLHRVQSSIDLPAAGQPDGTPL